jgi:hypothetical protein
MVSVREGLGAGTDAYDIDAMGCHELLTGTAILVRRKCAAAPPSLCAVSQQTWTSTQFVSHANKPVAA